MKPLILVSALLALASPAPTARAAAPSSIPIDATQQPSPPVRGRGPFPGSDTPGHSPGLPLRLQLKIPGGRLQANGSVLVDFILTNVGTVPLTLPCSVDWTIFKFGATTEILTLWISSDAIKPSYFPDGTKIQAVPTSAELYGRSDVPQSLCRIRSGKAIRVHASSRAGMLAGQHSFTAHAELLLSDGGKSQRAGTADSSAVPATLSAPSPSP